MMTTVNDFHEPLHELQFQRVRHQRCLMSRLVTVCFGERACRRAVGHKVVGHEMVGSDFRKKAYVEITWGKWRLMHAALGEADSVFFLDADVVLFRNPFATLGTIRHDIRFQAEMACDERMGAGGRWRCSEQPGWQPRLAPSTKSCSLNGGVLLVQSQDLAARVIAHEPTFDSKRYNRSWPMPIDQDAANAVANSGSFSSCALPHSQFVGLCWWLYGYKQGNRSFFDRLHPCELVTFHAHCTITRLEKQVRDRLPRGFVERMHSYYGASATVAQHTSIFPFHSLNLICNEYVSQVAMERMLLRTEHCVGHGANANRGDWMGGGERERWRARGTARAVSEAGQNRSLKRDGDVLGKWGPRAQGKEHLAALRDLWARRRPGRSLADVKSEQTSGYVPSASGGSGTRTPLKPPWAAGAETFVRAARAGRPVTDKVAPHEYQLMYGMLLLPLRERPTPPKLLEIGLGCDQRYGPGASVALWQRLFPGVEL